MLALAARRSLCLCAGITAADAAKSSATNAQTKGSSFLLTVILKRQPLANFHPLISRFSGTRLWAMLWYRVW